MTYKEGLEATKKYYPFERWKENFFPPEDEPEVGGMEQYSEENCNRTQTVFDTLIDRLILLGSEASEKSKIELFETAVHALNDLNEEIDGLIETGEREDLCELIDKIGIASGLDPKNYDDSIADQWREW